MLKKKTKKERIYTVKNTNDFTSNRNEETKFSFTLPSGITSNMIYQIINYGNLCKLLEMYKEWNARDELFLTINTF